MTVLFDEQTDQATTVPGTEITSRWVEITPALAEELLKSNTKNRNVRPRHLEKLVRDMAHDKYLITHQGIAMSDHGVLIDGQHRLQAIVETGKSQWVLYTTGLPMKSQEEVDGGAKRQAGDLGLLKESGYGHTKAAAVRLLLAVEELDHTISPAKVSRAIQEFTVADIQDGYRRYQDQIDRNITLAMDAAKVMRRRVGAAALIAASAYYPDRAVEFLTAIAENAVGLEASDPRVALVRFQGTGRIQSPVAAFVAFKAARYFHFGAQLSMIRYRQAEEMDLTKAPRDAWNARRDSRKKNGKTNGDR